MILQLPYTMIKFTLKGIICCVVAKFRNQITYTQFQETKQKLTFENEIVYLLNYILNNNFDTLENQTHNKITGAYGSKDHADQVLAHGPWSMANKQNQNKKGINSTLQ